MAEDEIAERSRGPSQAGGAHLRPRAQPESVKLCVKHGIEIVYHASFADEEALDC
ncbi:hypothetical protein [Azospirillum argentinense]|uniref:hypothetical protein n=1 Tax=Azospirillum argentinense TaxID=2970906 RepID=UPI001586970A|nr:hypothetical protein [Azospirillum argentinense]